MFNSLNSKQKIIILSVVVVFVILFIALIFIKPGSKYGDFIRINKYDTYIPNLPDDRREALNASLYNILKLNSNNDIKSISDANIREYPIQYNYDEDTKVHSGSFIVDVQSVNQSYLMSYRWSSGSQSSHLSGYTATAACLQPDKLIYGSFKCKDDFTNSQITNERDPIIEFLPYSTFNYTISASTDKKGEVELNVIIFLYSADTRNGGREAAIAKYKTEVVNWIKSKKLNPENYLINYSIN